VSTADISVLHSTEVAHFHHESWFPITRVCKAHITFPRMCGWVHYKAFTKAPLSLFSTFTKVSPPYISQRPQGTPLVPHKPPQCQQNLEETNYLARSSPSRPHGCAVKPGYLSMNRSLESRQERAQAHHSTTIIHMESSMSYHKPSLTKPSILSYSYSPLC
jgi:hypothetical protein